MGCVGVIKNSLLQYVRVSIRNNTTKYNSLSAGHSGQKARGHPHAWRAATWYWYALRLQIKLAAISPKTAISPLQEMNICTGKEIRKRKEKHFWSVVIPY